MTASTGCMLGWYDANGYSGTNGLKDMEALLGTRFAVTRVYNQWWPDHSSTITTATNDGRLVLSSHKPPKHASSWVEIARGDHDADITAMVAFYAGLAPKEVVFIFNHEPHRNASDGANKAPIYGTQADFRLAYRRIGQAFRDAGATNVKLGYCAVANFWACRGTPVGSGDHSYPGDDLVDVLCHDDYNFFDGDNPSKWDSMQTVMENTVALAKRLHKPLIWGEVGCQRPAAGKNRDAWFRDGAAWLKTGDAATYTLGWTYYHVDNHDNSGNYWRFAQGLYAPQGKQGYIDGFVGDSYFLTRPIAVSLRAVAPPPSGPPPSEPPTASTVRGGGIPSHVGFGTATVTMAGPLTVSGAGAIPSPADYQDPEESAGIDFGTATVSYGELPAYGGIFSPPIRYVLPAVLPSSRGAQRALFRHYGPYPQGVTVILRTDGNCVEVETPVEDATSIGGVLRSEIARVFSGGHIYQIDDEEGSHLVAAGYGDNIVIGAGLPTGTTWATYGTSTWGELRGYTWRDL